VKKRNYYILFTSIILLFLLLDQILKIWVKTNMSLGEQIPLLGNWLNLYFVENEGMAFGISLGQNIGKLFLSLARIVIVGFLIYYSLNIIKKEKANWIVISIFALIVSGALGNILDSAFYGLIFSESTPFAVATLFPPEGGYSGFLYGHVVDMFYVRLFYIPEWCPLWGGSHFFPAIFNIADACVTMGILGVLIFNGKIFRDEEEVVELDETSSSDEELPTNNNETVNS